MGLSCGGPVAECRGCSLQTPAAVSLSLPLASAAVSTVPACSPAAAPGNLTPNEINYIYSFADRAGEYLSSSHPAWLPDKLLVRQP